jgi:hypothetical protein
MMRAAGFDSARVTCEGRAVSCLNFRYMALLCRLKCKQNGSQYRARWHIIHAAFSLMMRVADSNGGHPGRVKLCLTVCWDDLRGEGGLPCAMGLLKGEQSERKYKGGGAT